MARRLDAILLKLFSRGSLVAHACPEPNRVAIGLTDLLFNAVEHGNLHISYAEKTELQETEEWETEIARRLSLPDFAHKQATITFHRSAERIEFTIIDQGSGFVWEQYLEMSPDLAFASHGRGIAMARALSFDTMEYRGVGNEIVCTINLPKDANRVSKGENMESTRVKRNLYFVFRDCALCRLRHSSLLATTAGSARAHKREIKENDMQIYATREGVFLEEIRTTPD